jgi:uncharacterized protein YndB with AHSA1/START domain
MITVQTIVNAPVEKVWEYWTEPEHITGWTFASDDWEAPSAENDIRTGGRFKTRMQSKDGKHGFDFEGTYDLVIPHERIEYTLVSSSPEASDEHDVRHVIVEFEKTSQGTKVSESFDPERENPEEMQRSGWQSILDNFKHYVERTVTNG